MDDQSRFPNRIWMYWENKPGALKPVYLQLCLETIERHRGDFELVLLDENSVQQYLEIPKKVWMLEEIAHRADYIRFHLLNLWGGVWLDADVILVKDIGQAVRPYIQEFDFVGYGREQGKPSINFMACHRGCKLIKQQAEKIDQVLEGKKTGLFKRKLKLQWTEIGHDILWELAREYPYYHHQLSRVAPVFWRDWKKFFQTDLDIGSFINSETLMVMLYNDFMRKPLQKTSREELLEGSTLLSKVFRASLSQ